MVSALLDEKIGNEQLPVGWPWRFFLFSVLIAATAAVSALGLTFGYKPFLESNLLTQDSNIEALSKQIPAGQQDEFVRFYSQLANLDTVLKKHVFSSSLFGLLESRTNAEVMYTTMEARIPERKVVLEGMAANYAVFSQQLQAYSTSPEIVGVIVNDSSAQDGKVRFRISLTIAPSVWSTQGL